uniref:F-box/LRR-repeat protein 15/At3g58940/PEG3-like LRR domain-containing protein n=1 Tax=Hordeum vulgare subsp. vulgare TaxID=112509 RepID=A0A8I7B9F4_HORVV
MEINNIFGKGTEERTRHDDDRLSALPDDVLLAVLQLVDAGTAVRAGALARRWRHLRCLLPDLTIDVADLAPPSPDPSSPRRTVHDLMAAYTDATAWFLAPSKLRSIKSLRLTFYLLDPYLRSIGDAVAESGCGSAAGPLEFTILADVDVLTVNDAERAMLARRFMSFLGACPAAFSGLTSLSLHSLCLGDSDISALLNTCSRLELLSLSQCGSSSDSVLRIDAPTSSLRTLEIREPFFHGVELASAPKLERLFCDEDVDSFDGSRPSVRFGHVPCLDDVYLSTMHLHYYYENPKQLFPGFSNLRAICLNNLETQKLAGTLFVIQAAPLLKKLSIKLYQPFWTTRDGYNYDTNVMGETPKFQHQNLSLLEMKGYAGLRDDVEVVRYIWLITERAVCLKKIHLLERCPLRNCYGVGCTCHVDEAPPTLLSKALAGRAASSIEITVESINAPCRH